MPADISTDHAYNVEMMKQQALYAGHLTEIQQRNWALQRMNGVLLGFVLILVALLAWQFYDIQEELKALQFQINALVRDQ